jgi:hypothetical protein
VPDPPSRFMRWLLRRPHWEVAPSHILVAVQGDSARA